MFNPAHSALSVTQGYERGTYGWGWLTPEALDILYGNKKRGTRDTQWSLEYRNPVLEQAAKKFCSWLLLRGGAPNSLVYRLYPRDTWVVEYALHIGVAETVTNPVHNCGYTATPSQAGVLRKLQHDHPESPLIWAIYRGLVPVTSQLLRGIPRDL